MKFFNLISCVSDQNFQAGSASTMVNVGDNNRVVMVNLMQSDPPASSNHDSGRDNNGDPASERASTCCSDFIIF